MLHSRPVTEHEARRDPLGAVILFGDYTGRTLVVRRADGIAASDPALRRLATDLDARFPGTSADATSVHWVVTNPWREWGGSAAVAPGLWLDRRLVAWGVDAAAVEAVLAGRAAALGDAG